MIVDMLDVVARPWWGWIVAVTWQAGLLAALVLLADLALRRTAWPEMAHALWMLVFLRLILPPALASPVSLVGLLTRPDAPQLVLAPAVRSPAMMSEMPLPPMPDAIAPVVATVPGAPPWAWPSAEAVALIVWLCGVAVVAGWIVSRMRALGRLTALGEPAPAHIIEALDHAARAVRLRRRPAIRISQAVAAPAVCGLAHPVILLPADDAAALRADELGHVLLHECAHVRRGDLLANAAATAFLALFWFNPLVWIAHRRLGQLRELACDATVARALRERTPDYRRTLARFARQLIAPPRLLGAPGLMEGPTMITRRLRYLDGNPWRGARLRRAGAALVAILAAATILPMCAPAREPAAMVEEPRQRARHVEGTWITDTLPSVLPPRMVPAKPTGEPETWSPEVRDRWVADYRAAQRAQQRELYRIAREWIAAGKLTPPRVAAVPPGEPETWSLETLDSVMHDINRARSEGVRACEGDFDCAELQMVLLREDPALRAQERLRDVVAQLKHPDPSKRHRLDPARDVMNEVDEYALQIVPPRPVYPDSARRAGIEDTVYVQAVVGKDGSIGEAHVVHGASVRTHDRSRPIFHAPALAAARDVRYAPAILDGKPVRTMLWIEVPFRLDAMDAR